MASPTTDVGVSQQRGKFSRIMARHPEIVCIVLAICFSLFSKYTKSQSKQYASQPAPRRFFSASSPVLDFPYGNIGDVGNVLLDSEVLFVMYYAPWCSKCMQVRTEFDRASQYLRDEVQLVGINCWYPSGQCRQQNNFMGFPVLYLYHTNLSGFKYNGLLKAEHMVEFVQTMLYPLTYLHNEQDIAKFLASNDNVMVGFFDFNASPQPPGFQQYYYSAMRTVEADPSNVVDYGVITHWRLAQQFDMNASQSVLLVRMLNDTLKYPSQRNFTSSALTRWCALLRRQPLVKWLLPTGAKSLTLWQELHKGPAVLLFTPHHPLSSLNHQHMQLREVAMTFLNCKNGSRVRDAVTMTTYLRWASILNHMEITETCKRMRTTEKIRASITSKIQTAKRCCHSVGFGSYNACDVCLNYEPIHPKSSQGCHIFPSDSNLEDWIGVLPSINTCNEARLNYNPSEHVTYCCHDRHWPSHSTSSFTSFNSLGPMDPEGSRDPYVDRALRDSKQIKCQKYRFQHLYSWYPSFTIPETIGEPKFPAGFSGSACSQNRSLRFYAMDSRLSGQFAQRLGVEPLGHNGSSMVLVDLEEELQYIDKTEVNSASIIDFLHQYVSDNVPRSLRSGPAPVDPWACSPVMEAGRKQEVCIVEVTSHTFHQVVMDKTKDVVVMVYAPWCGFCASFSHIYLSLAKYFRSARNLVFAKLNGDANDLPWEFTSNVYPIITLYPAKRKTESVTFPLDIERNLANLVLFVLQYASRDIQTETALNICTGNCLQNNLELGDQQVETLKSRLHLLSVRAGKVRQHLAELSTQAAEESQELDQEFEDSWLDHQEDDLQSHQHLLVKMMHRYSLQLSGAVQFLSELSALAHGSLSHTVVSKSVTESHRSRRELLAHLRAWRTNSEKEPTSSHLHEEL